MRSTLFVHVLFILFVFTVGCGKGEAVYSADRQIVNITGGGLCGWTTVNGTSSPVYYGTAELQLEFAD